MLAQDLIALLLPIAAASSWYLARRHYTQDSQVDHARSLTQAYRRGLNYLLDERTDEAISTVASILEQDSEPLDIHIALGNFFRRRGEVEKAIEIHKRLIQGQDLSPIQRSKVTFELGMDFMRAGLFDRAESIFQTLTASKTHGVPAMGQLLQIYQQQKDWHKAIECIVSLRRVVKPRRGETAAHFYCELAEEARMLHRLKDARDYLTLALKDDPGCVRASLAKGKLEVSNGEYRQAMGTLKSIEQQNPRFLPVALPLIRQCCERLSGGTPGISHYLDHLYERFGIMAAALERAEQIRGEHGLRSAMDYLMAVMERNSHFLVVCQVLMLMTDCAGLDPGQARTIRGQIQALMDSQPPFQCEHCGFSAKELHWRCPSCRHWDTVFPTAFGVTD